MSSPQTFEELRRMARELPKNVLVSTQHIHSLLDETERLVERIVDLERQLALSNDEKQLLLDTLKYPEHKAAFENLYLKRQLAEKQAEIESMRHAVRFVEQLSNMELGTVWDERLGNDAVLVLAACKRVSEKEDHKTYSIGPFPYDPQSS